MLRVFFNLVTRFLDGRDLAMCYACCRDWKDALRNNWKRQSHYVLSDSLFLPENFEELDPDQCKMYISNLLWFNHGFNYMELEYCGYDFGAWFFRGIFPFDRKAVYAFKDEKTHDLLLMSNFYAELEIDPKAKLATEKLHAINTLLPGFIKSWKIIRRPGPRVQERMVKERSFHRHYTIQLVLAAGLMTGYFSIDKKLEKRRNTRPDYLGYQGKGKRRKVIFVPELPPVWEKRLFKILENSS